MKTMKSISVSLLALAGLVIPAAAAQQDPAPETQTRTQTRTQAGTPAEVSREALQIRDHVRADDGSPATPSGTTPTSIQGQVLEVREQAQMQGGTHCTEMLVRTQQGDQMRVRLGEAGTCPGCVMQGDQVRLNLMSGGPVDGAYQAQSMKVRRTGNNYMIRNQQGDLIHTRDQMQLRDGTGAGDMNRHGSGHDGDSGHGQGQPGGMGHGTGQTGAGGMGHGGAGGQAGVGGCSGAGAATPRGGGRR